jgi:predicted dehydrogenase
MPNPEPHPVEAAIIGISGHARLHLFIALEQAFRGRLRLRAAVVINADEEAIVCAWLARLDCRIFASVEALWAEYSGQIDLCFVPTGIHLHAEMTIRALSAGANVLVEKPLVATLEQAEAVAEAELRSGRRVFVAYQDMYADATHTIKRMLCNGELGRVREIAVTGLWPRGGNYYGRNRWAGRLEVDGRSVFDSPVNNAFAHYLNLALFWSGPEPAEGGQPAVIEAELYRARPIESFDTASVRITTTTNARIGMFITHSCVSGREPRIEIRCEGGRITWLMGEYYEVSRCGYPKNRHTLSRGPESIFAMGDAIMRKLEGDWSAPACGVSVARLQTAVVAVLHSACPIRDIPARFVVDADAGNFVAIAGIADIIDRAGAELKLFSELGVEWASAGGRWPAEPHHHKPPPAGDRP